MLDAAAAGYGMAFQNLGRPTGRQAQARRAFAHLSVCGTRQIPERRSSDF